MKVKILAGLVSAFVYGGTAMAQDVDDSQRDTEQQQSPDNLGGSGLEQSTPDEDVTLQQQDVTPPPPPAPPQSGTQEQGVGGSGQTAPVPPPPAAQGQGGMSLYCTPLNPQQGTGGTGEIQGGAQQAAPQGCEPSSLQRQYDVGQAEPVPAPAPEAKAVGGSGYEETTKKKKETELRGVSVAIGGGVEGYTGRLAPNVNPGGTANLRVAIRPTSVLGVEVGYTGAVNEIDGRFGPNTNGTDIVRNGGEAALTLGLAPTAIQPYVLGGIGVSWYNIRHGFYAGFQDDTVGNVPVGVGLRTQVGAFTADLRGDYSFLFSQNFYTGTTNNAGSGRYMGSLNIGGTF